MLLDAKRHNPPLSREHTMQMQKQQAEVCASLARAHSNDEAQEYFSRCVALHTKIDGHGEKRVLAFLQLANNAHLLGKHREAIEMILDIFKKSGESRVVYIAV